MDVFQGAEPNTEDLAFIANSYAMRQLYWPSYTWKIQTEHLNKLDGKEKALLNKGIDIEVFQRRKSDLFDKINASFYHLQKLKENEEIILDLGKQMAQQSRKHTPGGVLGIVGMPYEPISYEYEALLVSLKTGIDIISMLLAQASGLSSNIDNLARLLSALPQTKKQNNVLPRVKKLIAKKQHVTTLDEFTNKDGTKSKRNFAVHEGSLPTGTINIQFAAKHKEIGILKTRTADLGGIEKTDFTMQQNLDGYASNLFYGVCDFIIDGLSLLLNITLPRGEKLSVYEERLGKRD